MVTDYTYRGGLQVGGWQNAQFDNFAIAPTSGSGGGNFVITPGSRYKIVNHNSGLLFEVNGWSVANGGLIDQ